MPTDEQHALVPQEMPDCQDMPLDKFSSDRTKALAEDRANSACGDARMFKAMYVRVAMMNAIHHETRSAYLAGYLQATKDLEKP